MTRLCVIAASLLVLTAGPVFAEEFYLVKDTSANKCKIVTEKPDDAGLVMISDTAYATKDEAKAAKKEAEECKK